VVPAEPRRGPVETNRAISVSAASNAPTRAGLSTHREPEPLASGSVVGTSRVGGDAATEPGSPGVCERSRMRRSQSVPPPRTSSGAAARRQESPGSRLRSRPRRPRAPGRARRPTRAAGIESSSATSSSLLGLLTTHVAVQESWRSHRPRCRRAPTATRGNGQGVHARRLRLAARAGPEMRHSPPTIGM